MQFNVKINLTNKLDSCEILKSVKSPSTDSLNDFSASLRKLNLGEISSDPLISFTFELITAKKNMYIEKMKMNAVIPTITGISILSITRSCLWNILNVIMPLCSPNIRLMKCRYSKPMFKSSLSLVNRTPKAYNMKNS